jgi:hypothetical protein
MTDNEYAATEIMGWELSSKPILQIDGERYYEYQGDGAHYVIQDSWLPDSNYEQLRLVEERVGHVPAITIIDGTWRVFTVLNDTTIMVDNESERAARLELARKCHEEASDASGDRSRE